MRTSLRFWAFVVVLYSASALVQWASWRWLRRVAPVWSARYRGPIWAFGAAMFLLPLSREVGFFFPRVDGFPKLSALGMLWHVCTWMSMALVGVVRAASWCARYVGERARGPSTRQPSPAPAASPLSPSSPSPAPAASPLSPSSPSPALAASSTSARRAETVGANPPDVPASPGRRLTVEGVVGAAAFVGSASMLGWGSLRGRYEWSVEEVPIRLARLPRELDGFTIVQISDLHVGPFVTERELRMGLGLIAGVRPDLIAVTGDIVDSQRRFIPLAARMLGALQARHGVVCIPGNHDHYTGAAEVLGALRDAGVDVLLNRAKIIPSSRGGLAILGVDDLWPVESRAGAPPDIESALASVPHDAAKVLLAHQPRYVATAHAFGIDLQLSGHTHGGQINPGVRPLAWFSRYVAGRYDLEATQLYVNRGFGTAGPPTRIGAPPEITKLVLVAG